MFAGCLNGNVRSPWQTIVPQSPFPRSDLRSNTHGKVNSTSFSNFLDLTGTPNVEHKHAFSCTCRQLGFRHNFGPAVANDTAQRI